MSNQIWACVVTGVCLVLQVLVVKEQKRIGKLTRGESAYLWITASCFAVCVMLLILKIRGERGMNIEVKFSNEELMKMAQQRSEIRSAITEAMNYLGFIRFTSRRTYDLVGAAYQKLRAQIMTEEEMLRNPDVERDFMMKKTATVFDVSQKLAPDEQELPLSDIVLRELRQTCAGALADLEGVDFMQGCSREEYLHILGAKTTLAKAIEKVYKGGERNE